MTTYIIYFVVTCHITMTVIFISNLFYLRKRKHRTPADKTPLVSILIPARNEAANLSRLIPSILSQQFASFELIVYDDASEDDTWNVINTFKDDRIKPLKGEGPPLGWAGKVHALYQASKSAHGKAFLFLDADVTFKDAGALGRLISDYQNLPPNSVLTSLPHYKGKGLLLVSIATQSLLVSIPWYLVRRTSAPSLSALNGQCWMIDAAAYKKHEPHKAVANEVLEDVLIGRYLKKNGIFPALVDLQNELSVRMYDSFSDAWRGFRKNAFLLMGNDIGSFISLFSLFIILFVVPPFLNPELLVLVYFNKLIADWRGRFSFAISLITPLCYLLGSTLQLDSAWHYLTGYVTWKGRKVG